MHEIPGNFINAYLPYFPLFSLFSIKRVILIKELFPHVPTISRHLLVGAKTKSRLDEVSPCVGWSSWRSLRGYSKGKGRISSEKLHLIGSYSALKLNGSVLFGKSSNGFYYV